LTGLFYESADFGGIRKHYRGTVALHARANDDWLTALGAELARIGLETQVELPDFLRFTVCTALRIARRICSKR